jgi:magnesium transporter
LKLSETIAGSDAQHLPEFRDSDGLVSGPFLAAVRESIAAKDKVRLAELAGDVHEADLGALLVALDSETRPQLIALLGDKFDYTALTEVDESLREELLDALPAEAVAKGVRELDSDDAIYLLQDLSPDERKDVLRHVPPTERVSLERGLRYPEESAGRLMQTEFIAVPPDWKVGDVIDHLRENRDLPDSFYELYAVDSDGRLAGAVRLDRLLRTMRPVQIADILTEDLQIVRAREDQESAARRFERYNLVSAPVLDEEDRLVGVLTADDVLDVIEEEAEEDLRALAGVRSAEDLSDTVIETARLRLPWLVLNMGTAFVAASVIWYFEATIEAVVAVAILMPVNAALGGNAGTQALAVAVRALATKELNRSNMARIIVREVFVGVFNGTALALLAGSIAGFAFGNLTLGLVLASAMVMTVIFATTLGILVPLTLDRLGIDPAVASGVFVTTTTDVFGFFTFLGLATVAFGLL